jgi:hypothetical protein
VSLPSKVNSQKPPYTSFLTPSAEQVIQFNDSNGHWFNVVAAPYTLLDVAIGEEGAPNADGDQPTNLGVVHVYRNETYNVSFHRKGIAYTVVTNPDNDAAARLLPILQSWEFTN